MKKNCFSQNNEELNTVEVNVEVVEAEVSAVKGFESFISKAIDYTIVWLDADNEMLVQFLRKFIDPDYLNEALTKKECIVRFKEDMGKEDSIEPIFSFDYFYRVHVTDPFMVELSWVQEDSITLTIPFVTKPRCNLLKIFNSEFPEIIFQLFYHSEMFEEFVFAAAEGEMFEEAVYKEILPKLSVSNFIKANSSLFLKKLKHFFL